MTSSAVPSRMIASASLERWTEIAGLVIRLRTERVSGEPPKQSAPSTHTPSTGRASGPTVVIQWFERDDYGVMGWGLRRMNQKCDHPSGPFPSTAISKPYRW
jgi:hypothetical protein